LRQPYAGKFDAHHFDWVLDGLGSASFENAFPFQAANSFLAVLFKGVVM
jgi:hypothetical protein